MAKLLETAFAHSPAISLDNIACVKKKNHLHIYVKLYTIKHIFEFCHLPLVLDNIVFVKKKSFTHICQIV